MLLFKTKKGGITYVLDFFKINGQIVYSYEYQETPLSDEKDEADVRAFIEGALYMTES